MRYLLDTHAFLWWIANDSRLSKPVRQCLEEERDTIFVSVVSLWEIVVKYKLGRLQIPDPIEPYLTQHLSRNKFELLTIHSHHVFRILSLPSLHRDPFDHLLIAQAQTESLTLITTDMEIRTYPVNVFW